MFTIETGPIVADLTVRITTFFLPLRPENLGRFALLVQPIPKS
jgi:hypothetical protein